MGRHKTEDCGKTGDVRALLYSRTREIFGPVATSRFATNRIAKRTFRKRHHKTEDCGKTGDVRALLYNSNSEIFGLEEKFRAEKRWNKKIKKIIIKNFVGE